ncbi:MAG: Spo0B domain-containing protein [Clostridia bacterium]|nr:Spo0B domain-containing protein [Clostridia bacterium]
MNKHIKESFNIDKALVIIYFVNIVQIFIVFGLIGYSYIFKDESSIWINENLRKLLVILCIVIIINIYIALRDANALKSLSTEYSMQGEVLEQIKDLNNTLRAQRHDFLNHLQVVYSLIEMDEYTEASNYIEMVYGDIKRVNRVLKTSDAAINALLQAKELDCEDRGISVHMKISTRLDKLKVPSWEMCRVLGNLIDNAIDATKENDNRFVEIEIFEESENYGFIVKNNGDMIFQDIRDKIFQPGFTTKGEKGQGMGLAISKEIVEKYGGSIDVDSNESITIFKVMIPFE